MSFNLWIIVANAILYSILSLLEKEMLELILPIDDCSDCVVTELAWESGLNEILLIQFEKSRFIKIFDAYMCCVCRGLNELDLFLIVEWELAMVPEV